MIEESRKLLSIYIQDIYRFTGSQTVLDIALEYDSIRFSKAECFIHRL